MIRRFEHSQVYVPSAVMESDPAQCGLAPFQEIFLQTKDTLKLHGWFFPSRRRSEWSDLVLLLLHGNAGNICTRVGFYQAWLELGLNVFAFDYRGYGRSEGEPSEEGTYLDGEAAYDFLIARGFAPEQIILLGKSLGGGIASELALRRRVGGVILQNTFTSVPDVGRELFPFLPIRLISRIKYDTVNKLPKIQVPILIMHSRGDEYIRFHHAERNFAAANEPKIFWEIHGSHNGVLEANRQNYLQGLETFLTRFFSRAPAARPSQGKI